MKNLVLVLIMVAGPLALANRESGGRLAARAVYVQFTSIGTGIDYFTQKKLQQYIAKAKHSKKIADYTYEQKGREGEAFYCVELKDVLDRVVMIKAVAPSIVKDTKGMGVQRTHVLLGMACGNADMAVEQDLSSYVD